VRQSHLMASPCAPLLLHSTFHFSILHSFFPILGNMLLSINLKDACCSGISCRRYHLSCIWECNGYDIRVSGARANDNVVLMHFLCRWILPLPIFMLRHGQCRGRKWTVRIQPPVVDTHMDTPSVSMIPVNTFCLLVLRRLNSKIFFLYFSRFSPVNSLLPTSNSRLSSLMVP
jgi:hypothetical protein